MSTTTITLGEYQFIASGAVLVRYPDNRVEALEGAYTLIPQDPEPLVAPATPVAPVPPWTVVDVVEPAQAGEQEVVPDSVDDVLVSEVTGRRIKKAPRVVETERLSGDLFRDWSILYEKWSDGRVFSRAAMYRELEAEYVPMRPTAIAATDRKRKELIGQFVSHRAGCFVDAGLLKRTKTDGSPGRGAYSVIV